MPRQKKTPTRSLDDGDALEEMEVTFQTPTFIPSLAPPGVGQTGGALAGGGGGSGGKGGKGGKGKGKGRKAK